MTEYRVPPVPDDPKPRFVVITDPLEIQSIQRAGLRDIIGKCETASGTASRIRWTSFAGSRSSSIRNRVM